MDLKKHLILYVDDEKPNRVVFEAAFGKKYRVRCLEDPHEALAMLKDENTPIGALVTDQRMPGMSGDDLLAAAKVISPETIRIIITAYSDLEPILRAVNEGLVYRYIIKPWDRKELDEMLQWAVEAYELGTTSSAVQARLAKTERLLTLGQVAAAVVHDIRQPLSAIRMNAQQLVMIAEGAPALPDILAKAAAEPSIDADQRKNLELLASELLEIGREIRDAATLMHETLKDVRRFEKREEPDDGRDAEPVQLLKLACSMCRTEAHALGATIDVDVPASLPRIRINGTHLLQIVINVVRNAVQACGRAGKGKRALVQAAETADAVRFVVADEGPGMTPDVLANVGKAFYTTRAEGTGLGIGQVQRLLGIAGGTFAIESAVGRGTTVTFTVPKA